MQQGARRMACEDSTSTTRTSAGGLLEGLAVSTVWGAAGPVPQSTTIQQVARPTVVRAAPSQNERHGAALPMNV